jgi:glycosyltransferase involved in cell wall biosynthesis
VDFGFIGNFRHAPNADAVRWLKTELWPAVRRQFAETGLPPPVLHVHGAYPSKEFMQMDRAETGFQVLGPAEDAYAFLAGVRVNLAPLRFGAGLKGKIADGWSVGTPCVATPVAAEGMGDPFGGLIALGAVPNRPPGDVAGEFARACLRLHQDEVTWRECQAQGFATLRNTFSEAAGHPALAEALAKISLEGDLVRRMLRHHSIQSARHFSRWIEIKNQKNRATGIPNEIPKLEDCAVSKPEVRSPQLM